MIVAWLKKFVHNVSIVPKRFMLASIASVGLFGLGIYIINEGYDNLEHFGRYIAMLLALLFLGVSAQLWNESLRHREIVKGYTRIGVVIFVLVYWFFLPKELNDYFGTSFVVKHILWHFCFLLTIFFTPFLLTKKEFKNNLFYQHALTVVLYIFIGVIFSVISFLLGTLLLFSLDTLFDLTFDNGFEYWWVFCASIVGPVTFLANLSGRENREEVLSAVDNSQLPEQQERECPRVIWALVTFVIIPFVSVYFVILYIYVGKIIFTWQWPEGTVSWLILAFSIIGWLTYFTVFVWQERYPLFKYFIKIFPWVALPQVIVLFIALWWRVDAYGITMNRYFLAAVGVWLLLIAMYTLFIRSVKIIFLPASLFVLLFLISVGPWGVIAVAKKSQTNRLWKLIKEYQLVDSQGIPQDNADKKIPLEVQSEMSSIIRYIVGTHGTKSLKEVFPGIVAKIYEISKDGDCIAGDCSRWQLMEGAKNVLGIKYESRFQQEKNRKGRFDFSVYELHNSRDGSGDKNRVMKVKNYEFLIRGIYFFERKDVERWVLKDAPGEKITLQCDKDGLQILSNATVLDNFLFKDMAQQLLDAQGKDELKEDDFIVTMKGQQADLQINISNIRGEENNKHVRKVDSFSGDILLRLK